MTDTNVINHSANKAPKNTSFGSCFPDKQLAIKNVRSPNSRESMTNKDWMKPEKVSPRWFSVANACSCDSGWNTIFYFIPAGNPSGGDFWRAFLPSFFFFVFFLYPSPTREKKREKEGAKDIKRHCDCCINGYKNVKNIWNEIKSKSHTHTHHII